MSAPPRHVWAALGIVYVVWGSTYLGIKIAVDTLPPLLTAGTRFLAAGGLLCFVLVLCGRSLRVTRCELLSAATAGLLLLALGVGVVHVAETRIDSSVAAMIAGTVPLQVILLPTATGDCVSRALRLSAAADRSAPSSRSRSAAPLVSSRLASVEQRETRGGRSA